MTPTPAEAELQQLRAVRTLFAAVVAAAVVGGLAGCGTSSGPGLRGTLVDPPQRAPSFVLHDQDTKAVSMAGQRGRVVLVAFLYTRCPDVCPLIASTLSDAVRQLGADRDRARVLAISVDPKGDTPERVRAFIRKRNLVDEFRYLTGGRADLARVWKAFHVGVYPELENTIAHSSFEVLIDAKGRIRSRYDAQARSADLVHDLRSLIDED